MQHLQDCARQNHCNPNTLLCRVGPLMILKPWRIERSKILIFNDELQSQEVAMDTNEKPVDVVRVRCEVCLKEVPISEAKVFEAVDYFVHFCGLECYDKWKNQRGTTADPAKKPAR